MVTLKGPDILSEAPLPPTLSHKMSLELAYFLIQSLLTPSPLASSPHKCVTSSITFLFKKMSCPPWSILETLNLSQDKGVNLLDQLTLSGSVHPTPTGLEITRKTPSSKTWQTHPVVLNPSRIFKLWNPPMPRLHSIRIRSKSLWVGPRQYNCLKPPPVILVWSQNWNPLE